MVTIGSIIGGAFRLFREQPAAVLVWGAIYGVLTAGSSMLMLSMMRSQMATMTAGTGSPFGMLQWIAPFYLLTLLVMLVLSAAAFRAVMKPEARAGAFLRLGIDEILLFVLGVIWFVINIILYFVLVLVAGSFVFAIIGGTGGSAPGTAVGFGLLIALPIIALMIFIHIRLSPAIPLTILRRELAIGEAWRLTKGHFWTLFVGYLVVMVILIAGYLLVASVAMGGYWMALAGGGLTPQSIEAANAYRMSQLTTITPMTILSWVLTGAFGAISYAMWAGSVGTATKDLLGVTATDYAARFE